MFAIDCLKANGTHLGTCIDRFYFGSCCHIEPHHDILDNAIDPAIIPPREPPLRLTNTTTVKPITITKITYKPPLAIEKKPESDSASNSASTTVHITTYIHNVTKIPISTKPTGTPQIIKVTTTKLKPQLHKESTTTEVPHKLTTFQSIAANSTSQGTVPSKHTVRTTTSKPTSVSKPQTSKPLATKPVIQYTATLRPSTNTTRPISTKPSSTKPKPSQPIKITKPTVKPTSKPSRNATKPIKSTTTRRPVVTTKLPVSISTISSTSKRPISTTSSETPQPTTIRVVPTTQSSIQFTQSSTLKRNITNVPESTTKATSSSVNALPLTSFNNSLVLGAVSGNPETNEIEAVVPVKDSSVSTQTAETTTKPSLVTWSIVNASNTPKPSVATGE